MGAVERQHSYQVSNLGVILWKRAHDFHLSFEPPPEDLDAVEVSVAEFGFPRVFRTYRRLKMWWSNFDTGRGCP
jgi:hypothetical protein